MTTDTINDERTIAGKGEEALLAGRYRVVRQLGQGGMGSVWLAEDTQLDNKLFAIKMLPAILVANKRAYRQLKDEALVAMQLVHPNIVQIRAFEENNGNPFLVMDYIDGQTLDDYLAEHTGTTGILPVGHALPEADVLRILRPIAAALDYAHTKGVVHRDVKPGNVMIAKDGTPYILDFGIAREIQETLTRVTGKLSSGTLLYMSPEQLNGAQPKPAQDVYSFAAMIYECLKGEPPFVRGQIEHQILNNPPDPLPTEVLTGNAAILAAGIMSGLAKKPEDRPASCTAVLGGRASSRAKPGGARLLRPDERKPSSGWKILLAVILLALVGVGGGVWYHLQELKHEQEAAELKAEEELARLKASSKEKKDKAENLIAELQEEGAKDHGGESFRKIEALHAAGTNAFSRGMYVYASVQFDEIIKAASECKQVIGQSKDQKKKKQYKLVKTPPKPQEVPDSVKKFGKGAAADKPLANIDMKKMLEQGYRYGARNQIATSEAQRCVSLIKAAILREWQKESSKWYSGLRPIEVDFHLGPGGAVKKFTITRGSGDADVDRTAQSALRRLQANGGVPGLSAQFIEQFPRLPIEMELTQGR